jgi:hypothetical protein
MAEAEAIAGSLSKTSKMPGYSYGIPAQKCKVGTKLHKLSGSVCASCYALKGMYRFPNVQDAQARRFSGLQHPQWVEALVFMIASKKGRYFRWHDSGDIQSLSHLRSIYEVARRTTSVIHWLPTRENSLIRESLRLGDQIPSNLTLRVSAAMIDGPPLTSFNNTSTVVTDGTETCPAHKQDNQCKDCRACWDPKVKNISYLAH